MRFSPTSFLALALSCGAGHAVVAATPDAEARYQTLLAAAKAAAPNADWAALRLAYSERPGFAAIAQSGARRQMLEAGADCKVALPSAKAVIEENYVDPDAHFVAAYCEDASGDAVAAKLDRDIGRGLISSIETGDGFSAATAFTPISVDEEYAVMRALGQRVDNQSLTQQGGHSYDVLNTIDATGGRRTYWFAIDRVLAAESAALAPGSVSEGGPPSRTP